jgi:hypothetical protein
MLLSSYNIPRGKKIRFNSNKVDAFFKVLITRPWSLTLYGLRHVPAQPTIYVAKDKIKCATAILAVFYCVFYVACHGHPGRVLASRRNAFSATATSRDDYAGCCKAINSSPQSGLSSFFLKQLYWMRANYFGCGQRLPQDFLWLFFFSDF